MMDMINKGLYETDVTIPNEIASQSVWLALRSGRLRVARRAAERAWADHRVAGQRCAVHSDD